MRKFNYRFKVDEENKVVVALTTFAGRAVSGKAKCAPEDTFDVEKGKELAAARCSLKVAKKRLCRSANLLASCRSAAAYWQTEEEKMQKYAEDSLKAFNTARAQLEDVVESFR